MKKEPTLLAQFDVTVNSPTPNWHAFRRMTSLKAGERAFRSAVRTPSICQGCLYRNGDDCDACAIPVNNKCDAYVEDLGWSDGTNTRRSI